MNAPVPQPIGMLLDHLARASSEVVLIAPFIKRPVMQMCVDAVPPKVPIRVYTRWDAAEVANGVSDPEIISIKRIAETIWLVPTLHAKAYIADDLALVGSANLTQRALGLTQADANLEVLIPTEAHSPQITTLLQTVQATARPTNPNYAAAVREQARTTTNGQPDTSSSPPFYPTCRDPQRVLSLTLGDSATHPVYIDIDAEADLLRLNLPSGLSEVETRELITARLRNHPDLADLYATGTLNSAALRQSIDQCLQVSPDEAGRLVETLVRWLRAFEANVHTRASSYDIVLGREFP